MTGPSLRKPWTDAEQRVAVGIRANRSYDQIAVDLACKPRTIRAHVESMAAKIEGLAELGDDLPPRHKVRAFLGIIEWEATKRERFFKTA